MTTKEFEDGGSELGELEEVTSEIMHCRFPFKSVEDIAAGHSLACVEAPQQLKHPHAESLQKRRKPDRAPQQTPKTDVF